MAGVCRIAHMKFRQIALVSRWSSLPSANPTRTGVRDAQGTWTLSKWPPGDAECHGVSHVFALNVNPGLITPRLFLGGCHLNSQLLLFGGATTINQPGFFLGLTLLWLQNLVTVGTQLGTPMVPTATRDISHLPSRCRISLSSTVFFTPFSVHHVGNDGFNSSVICLPKGNHLGMFSLSHPTYWSEKNRDLQYPYSRWYQPQYSSLYEAQTSPNSTPESTWAILAG